MSRDVVDLTSTYGPADQVSSEELPVIDPAGYLTGGPDERADVIAQVGVACREVGFFYLTGHGVSQHLPMQTPTSFPGSGFNGANRWPDHQASFRVVLEQFQAATVSLAAELRAVFALALGLHHDAFESWFTKPLLNLQPAHYRGQPSPSSESRQLGVGEHRDTGAFTLLLQDDVPGLEVRDRSGRWIEAPIIPGAFIVNIGDSLMSWTNGEFVSTPHRVINRSTSDRYIAALFMNPDYHCVVEPLAPLVSPARPPRFEPVDTGVYWEALAASAYN